MTTPGWTISEIARYRAAQKRRDKIMVRMERQMDLVRVSPITGAFEQAFPQDYSVLIQ